MFFAPVLFKLWRHVHFPLWVAIAVMIAAGATVGCFTYILIERPLLNWLGGSRTPAPASSPS
jgi:hypothetical protein